MNIKQTTKTFIQGRQDCVPPSQFPKVSEGAWQAPEDLVSFGLQQSRVLMMNENHDGPAHCPRTRRVGLSVLPAAHRAGCRILAMEAISEEEAERFNQTRNKDNMVWFCGHSFLAGQVVKDRLGNKEDNYYERNVDR